MPQITPNRSNKPQLGSPLLFFFQSSYHCCTLNSSLVLGPLLQKNRWNQTPNRFFSTNLQSPDTAVLCKLPVPFLSCLSVFSSPSPKLQSLPPSVLTPLPRCAFYWLHITHFKCDTFERCLLNTFSAFWSVIHRTFITLLHSSSFSVLACVP